MDKDESPEGFLLGIRPRWPLSTFYSPEIDPEGEMIFAGMCLKQI